MEGCGGGDEGGATHWVKGSGATVTGSVGSGLSCVEGSVVGCDGCSIRGTCKVGGGERK